MLIKPTEIQICIYVEQRALKLRYVLVLIQLFLSLSVSLVPYINRSIATQIFGVPELLSVREIILTQLIPVAFSKQ